MKPAAIARLDELAALALGRHPLAPTLEAAPDVARLLSASMAGAGGEIRCGGRYLKRHNARCSVSVAVPVRLPSDLLAEVETLADDLAAAGRPEALAAGGRWGRAAVIRLALARGVAALRAEIADGGEG